MARIRERPERIGARDVRPDIVDAQRQAIAAIFDAEPPIGIGAAGAQPLRANRVADRSRRMADAGDRGQRRAGEARARIGIEVQVAAPDRTLLGRPDRPRGQIGGAIGVARRSAEFGIVHVSTGAAEDMRGALRAQPHRPDVPPAAERQVGNRVRAPVPVRSAQRRDARREIEAVAAHRGIPRDRGAALAPADAAAILVRRRLDSGAGRELRDGGRGRQQCAGSEGGFRKDVDHPAATLPWRRSSSARNMS
ncbi:hypothetical protein WR25_04054 [Diploscapter pachys]|uniref:Uncharacterized protein n=1 Tax=Diploscapter pachys TaxID=2018661 RepID=A0A2A2M1Y5_9BILA|nr:hypothetical protein WR25_04054 [Diploscapter pachys]